MLSSMDSMRHAQDCDEDKSDEDRSDEDEEEQESQASALHVGRHMVPIALPLLLYPEHKF